MLATDVRVRPGENRMSGSVGIGVWDTYKQGNNKYWALNEALTVSGDMRVGIVRPTGNADFPGGEPKLFFSGGPKFSLESGTNDNSENRDPMFIQRVNGGPLQNIVGANDIRISVGDNTTVANSLFTIGYTSSNVFNHVMSTRAFSLPSSNPFDPTPAEPSGYLGIGTSEPVALLHVSGSKSTFVPKNSDLKNAGDDKYEDQFLVVLDNETTSPNINTLAIKIPPTLVGEDSNFVTFLISDGQEGGNFLSAGAIEGYSADGILGVAYSSPERDYAEYIPKMNPDETINAGDIIAIINGQVTRDTTHAQQRMVVSSAPIILGNWPGKKEEKNYEMVAFLGQVPVNVKGSVKAGDYIIDSQDLNGVGIAVSAEDIHSSQIDLIVGRAWESATDKGIKKVNTLIGFDFTHVLYQQQLQAMLQEATDAKKNLTTLETFLESAYQSRQKQLVMLQKELGERP